MHHGLPWGRKLVYVFIFLFVFAAEYASATQVWTIQKADTTNGIFNRYFEHGVGVDHLSHPYIIYAESQAYPRETTLYLTWHDGTSWNYETLLTSNYSILSLSLHIDSQDTVHLFYIKEDTSNYRSLRHIYGCPGDWHSEEIPHDPALYLTTLRVTLDGSDHIHMGVWIYDTALLYHVSNATGSWQWQEVSTTTSVFDPAAGPDGSVYFIAQVENLFEYYDIAYFYHDGSIWQKEVLAFSQVESYDLQLICDRAGHLYFASVDWGDEINQASRILYADTLTGHWRTETLEQSNDPNWLHTKVKLAVDSSGLVQVIGQTYHWETHQDQLRHFEGGYQSWQSELLRTEGPDEEFDTFALTVDQEDVLHIAGTFNNNVTLDHIFGRFGDWHNETVGYSGRVGQQSLLLLDSDDRPHIIGKDTHWQQPFHLRSVSNGWTKESVSVPGSLVSATMDWMDACIDPCDHLYIAYRTDEQNNAIQYATDASGSWVSHDVLQDYPLRPAIAAFCPDDVHLSAYRMQSYPHACVDSLRSHTNRSGSWQTQIYESSSQRYPGRDVFHKMVVDARGTIHHAFIWGYSTKMAPGLYWYTYDLKYGIDNGSSWHSTTLAANVCHYARLSLAVDHHQKVHISYYDQDDYGLKYASNAGGYWSIDTLPTAGAIWIDSSVATDSSNGAHVCFVEDGWLNIGHYHGGTWQIERITDIPSSYHGFPSLQIDTDDHYHISFYRNAAIYYATNSIARPLISTEPADLVYYVVKDSAASRTLTLRNDGSDDLIISDILLTGPDAGKFSHGAYNATIGADATGLLKVDFDTSASGEFEAALAIHSNDSDHPVRVVPLHGHCIDLASSHLECKTSLVDFGGVIVGQSSEPPCELRFRNTGAVPLTVNGIVLTDSDHFYFSPRFVDPIPLEADEYFDLDVGFNPQSTGPWDAMLNIYTHYDPFDPQPACSVALVGEGIPVPIPELEVVPEDYDLGDIQVVLKEKEQVYSILNKGDSDLIIDDIRNSGAAGITVDLNGGGNPVGVARPVVIAAGGGRTFSVTFAPGVLGDYGHDVMIYSNDPEHGKYLTLHFTGRGSHWNRCDIDIDGAVGLSDLSLLAQQWLQRPDSPSADIAPINKPDEFVDLEDWAALSQAWLMFMD